MQRTPEQLAMIEAAKGSPLYEGWRPYCLVCSSILPMTETPTGFRCRSCKNDIGFDLCGRGEELKGAEAAENEATTGAKGEELIPATDEQIERFWLYVEKGPDCWTWTGPKVRHDYGRFNVGHKHLSAHRFAWALANGPIPDGAVVRHACDNPPCVNPAHLLIGTQCDNMRDAMQRNRHPIQVHGNPARRGEASNTARLTADDVAQIRLLAGTVSNVKLGKRFGVSTGQIQRIVTGKAWKHIQSLGGANVG